MKYAQISDGEVIQIILCEEDFALTLGPDYVLAQADTAIGDSWDGSAFTPSPTPTKTAPEIIAAITTATQLRLDAFAQSRNYDGILSACTYATSGVPKFAAEGQCCVDARDATWSALYTVMDEVIAMTRPMPESFDDIVDDLPALAWPA